MPPPIQPTPRARVIWLVVCPDDWLWPPPRSTAFMPQMAVRAKLLMTIQSEPGRPDGFCRFSFHSIRRAKCGQLFGQPCKINDQPLQVCLLPAVQQLAEHRAE